MDEVLNILFQCFSGFVSVSKALVFSALGFDLNLWDFKVALFLISCLVPIFFSIRHTDSLTRYIPNSSSERNNGKNSGKSSD